MLLASAARLVFYPPQRTRFLSAAIARMKSSNTSLVRIAVLQWHIPAAAVLQLLAAVFLANGGLHAAPPAALQGIESTQFFYPTESKSKYLEHTNRYERDRQKLLTQHARQRFSADEKLNPAEMTVSNALHHQISNHFRTHRTLTTFEPTRPFYNVKSDITNTSVFQLLRKMPKGALLHTHLGGAGRMEWIISNALTLSNCYVSWPGDTHPDRGGLNFFLPPKREVQPGFVPIGSMVGKFQNIPGGFGAELTRLLTIGAEDEGPNRMWGEFGNLFKKLDGFIRYQPVFTNYLFDAFETLWNDGVYYVELRDGAAPLYNLDGVSLTNEAVVGELIKVRDMMKAAHPGFDCRLILADVRSSNGANALEKLKRAIRLRELFPNFIIGYDLIGEEDPNESASTLRKVTDLLPALSFIHENYGKAGLEIPYYLHDGESAWADNDNLFDAVLLRAPRIGHGFNLFRYPTLYPILIRNNVALEICPISNQVLGLAPDLRIHPAHGYLNAGIQCVLASDDPAIFGNEGLSYDFWEAIMAWNLDLAAVKKLARNSITFSGLDSVNKKALMRFWERQWNAFVTSEAVTNSVTSLPQQ
jgi:adenosine deaminase CECR1